MKVKFGDLTKTQIKEICNEHISCRYCPLCVEAITNNHRLDCVWLDDYDSQTEIDLPDEEVKDDA